MNKILRYSFAMLLACIGITAQAQSVQADVWDDILWQEDWTGWTAKIDPLNDPLCPSGNGYDFYGTTFKDDGSYKGGTAVYDDNLAGGEAPELLIAKSGGYFTVNLYLPPIAEYGLGFTGTLYISFKCNKNITVTTDVGTLGEATVSGNDYVYPLTLTTETNYLSITFTNNLSSNCRFDNVKLTKEVGKKPAGLSYGTSSRTVTIGADDNVFPELQNANNLPVTYSSSVTDVATIDADGVITLVAAGKTVIKAEFAGNDEYEAGYAQYELTVKEGADPNAKGGVNNPYTVTEALAVLATMENNVKTDQVYVKGVINSITEISLDHGNATFNITDDTNGLLVYRAKYLNKENFTDEAQLMIGDEVVVCGQLVNYLSNNAEAGTAPTPEMAQGGYVYSIQQNGQQTDPEVQGEKIAEYDFTTATEFPFYWMGDRDADQNSLAPSACGGTASIEVKNGALVVENTVAQTNNWDLQFFILDWFNVQEGYNYDIAIDMEATSPVDFWLNFGTWNNGNMPLYGQSAPAERGWKVCTIENANFSTSNNDSHILFQCGSWVGTVKIYKVQLYEYGGVGIQNVKTENNVNAPVYNLAGQRVDENYRGIVIKNGKKVVQ